MRMRMRVRVRVHMRRCVRMRVRIPFAFQSLQVRFGSILGLYPTDVVTDLRPSVLLTIVVCLTCVRNRYSDGRTNILTEWFLAHKAYPYPNTDEKNALAKATNLSLTQM